MALQLIEAFQCSVTYSIKQISAFFDCCNAFIDFIESIATVKKRTDLFY